MHVVKRRVFKMVTYYLAVDIGASSGRHILGHMEGERLVLEEIHRFPNGMKEQQGEKCWDYHELFREIVAGMKKCGTLNKIPVSVSVDTWGVDFVLLDEQDQILGNMVGYRDGRTAGMEEKVYEKIPEDVLYARTGIQKAIFNTIYQLMAVKEKHPTYLEQAKSFLMVPDYFHYLLCGVKANEYTDATTTQLLHPVTMDWDWELIDLLGFPKEMFQNVRMPGTVLGELTEALREEVGYSCQVVLPASHDTGSAVLAVPSTEPYTVYISSGTWSLMGVERAAADCRVESRLHNFTNEGGYDYRFRYLKNIMGLWMIQSVKAEMEKEGGVALSYGELCEEASRQSITSLVDCNGERFLAPENMTGEIRLACRESGQQVPIGAGEVAAVVYNSLAKCYGDTIGEIEELTSETYRNIHIVGGGSNAEYLNELTAKYTGRTVYAGPTEATAIGNLMVQMLATGEWENLDEARRCVFISFGVKTYQ
jgi:rhamnulokinase